MKKLFLLLFILCTGFSCFCQNHLPVIRATSKDVDIRVNDVLNKEVWTIVPSQRPDVYTTSVKKARITFITDLDSISFTLKVDKPYDFIILFNGDSAFTRAAYVDSPLDKLKKGSVYDPKDMSAFPAFTYQSPDDSALVRLRKTYNLDSIAGKGTDAMKLINLLHWVHNLFPHAGMLDNPEPQNAISMINDCKKDNHGINCMGFSIILNECYLALGYKSRSVWCIGKDSTVNEAHWINLVWSPELKDWVYIDPTFDAYVMDEKGKLLSIREVRERLVKGQTLIVNPDANLNRRRPASGDYLEIYMANELYRVRCTVRSETDAFTDVDGKVLELVELLPLDAYQQTPKVSKKIRNGKSTVMYKTNNQDLFWQAPPDKL